MRNIKFGTDGWRAIIGDDFTTENVKRISIGVSRWLIKNKGKKIVIGYDTRFGSKRFAQNAANIFASHGIRVFFSDEFCTTPMVSLSTKLLEADLGVVITASHNAPAYNGYKLKGPHGGPAFQDQLDAIEELIPDTSEGEINGSFTAFLQKGIITIADLEKQYLSMLNHRFDLEALAKNDSQIAYDSMFGAGKRLMFRLFPNATHLHQTDNPGFEGISPEPIDRNLTTLEKTIKNNPALKIGIANDGDADRIGLFDETGQFIDSHHILLLLLYYLAGIQKKNGTVVASAAVTDKLEKLASAYNLALMYTPIGFKHITPLMLKDKVLLAGEEAGGMAVHEHLPERDGIYIALLILELMHRTGKTLKQLVELIYREVGSFAYNRNDLSLKPKTKDQIVELCKKGQLKQIGGFKVKHLQKVDGWRYTLENDRWLMIRPSGTEPVLRLYAQAPTRDEVDLLLEKTVSQLGEITGDVSLKS